VIVYTVISRLLNTVLGTLDPDQHHRAA